MAETAPQKWQTLGPFTVFDVETTGMSPVNDRIVELAAVRFDVDGSEHHYQTLINPGRHITEALVRVHHIDDAMVANSPNFTEAGYEFMNFCRNSILVAHNARFDLGFLQESLNRCGLPLWQGKTMDTIALLKRTHAKLQCYKLQYLREAFHLDDDPRCCQAHRALADAIWTGKLLEIALTELLRRA